MNTTPTHSPAAAVAGHRHSGLSVLEQMISAEERRLEREIALCSDSITRSGLNQRLRILGANADRMRYACNSVERLERENKAMAQLLREYVYRAENTENEAVCDYFVGGSGKQLHLKARTLLAQLEGLK